MTVHMVRVMVEPPKGDAENAVDNWVTNYNEWTGDSVEHTMTETTAGLDSSGTTYVRGDYRFVDEGESPTDILSDLSSRLQSLQGGLWHRLGYHVCSHDEDNSSPCSWNDPDSEILEWGNIPSDIPDL